MVTIPFSSISLMPARNVSFFSTRVAQPPLQVGKAGHFDQIAQGKPAEVHPLKTVPVLSTMTLLSSTVTSMLSPSASRTIATTGP